MLSVGASPEQQAQPARCALATRSASEMIITDADVNLCLGSGELLPCPFCGAWAMSAGELTPNGRATCWKVSCTGSKGLVPDCCASVWATHRDQSTARRTAVERWNRRQPNEKLCNSPGSGASPKEKTL